MGRGDRDGRGAPRHAPMGHRRGRQTLRSPPVGDRDAADAGHTARGPTVGHGGSAIDRRTTRHAGYALIQRRRKLVEQAFGWLKTVALFRKLRHRGGRLVDWLFSFGAAAYNLVRWRNLVAAHV